MHKRGATAEKAIFVLPTLRTSPGGGTGRRASDNYWRVLVGSDGVGEMGEGGNPALSLKGGVHTSITSPFYSKLNLQYADSVSQSYTPNTLTHFSFEPDARCFDALRVSHGEQGEATHFPPRRSSKTEASGLPWLVEKPAAGRGALVLLSQPLAGQLACSQRRRRTIVAFCQA